VVPEKMDTGIQKLDDFFEDFENPACAFLFSPTMAILALKL
jgi:hypothetical protein